MNLHTNLITPSMRHTIEQTDDFLEETHHRCKTTHMLCHHTREILEATHTRLSSSDQLLRNITDYIDRVQQTIPSSAPSSQNP